MEGVELHGEEENKAGLKRASEEEKSMRKNVKAKTFCIVQNDKYHEENLNFTKIMMLSESSPRRKSERSKKSIEFFIIREETFRHCLDFPLK